MGFSTRSDAHVFTLSLWLVIDYEISPKHCYLNNLIFRYIYMLDKKICSNLQFVYRSYVKKPMEKKSENSIEALASSLFVEKSDGRAQLEYPFLFLCCIVGLLVRFCLNFRGNKNA